MWSNAEIERVFAEIADLLRISGEDRFRVRAYERAAGAIGAARQQVGSVDPARLTEVPGIGDATAKKIVELRETGRIGMLEELRTRVPPAVRELVQVPGLGPQLARRLHDEAGIDSLEALREALDAGTVAEVSGLGPKKAASLRTGLARLGGKEAGRVAAAEALPLGRALVTDLGELDAVDRVAYAGSLRRLRDTIGDLDVLVATSDPAAIRAALADLPAVAEVTSGGDKKVTLRPRGSDLRADLRFVPHESWGAAMVYFTGSKAHNVRIRERAVRRGLSLNEYDVHRGEERIAGATEEEVYAALELPWIPAPMREDTGEVEAAQAGDLPAVVTLDDLRGDLHGHSDWSGDGRVPLEGMLEAAADRGWEYWAVTDHAIDLSINGLDVDGFARRRDAIAGLRDRVGIEVLDGVELNIDGEGDVDFDWDVLARFDVCVASIHTLMDRPREQQTRRVLTAMANPYIHVIGHLTCRKLGRRPAIDIDVDAVVAEAARTGTALEVNGSPNRLDISGEIVRKAVEAGATITISTDAHSLGDLDNVETGVTTAQRGWATPADVLNCRDLEGLRAFVAAKAARGEPT